MKPRPDAGFARLGGVRFLLLFLVSRSTTASISRARRRKHLDSISIGHAVQPFLDDSIALGADPAVIAPTVNSNVEWPWFRGVEKKYRRARKRHNNRKNGRVRRGRPRRGGGPGRSGYDFYGYLRAFLLAPLFDVEATPAAIARALHSNPAFLVECAFGCIRRGRRLVANPIPSVWALNEFENIMTEADLWEEVRRVSTRKAISFKAIPKRAVVAVDPMAVKAYARPEKKKRCACADKARCRHRRREADPDARYYKKGGVRILRAYRPAIVGEVTSGIPLVSIMQPDTHNVSAKDYEKIIQEVIGDRSLRSLSIEEVLADAEFDSQANRETTRRLLGVPLYAPANPRGRRPRRVGERGIRVIDPAGVPVCEAKHRFEYVGKDTRRGAFVFRAPQDGRGRSVCRTCPIRCTTARGGRYVRVPRRDSPWVDWKMPQHSLAFRMRWSPKATYKGDPTTRRSSAPLASQDGCGGRRRRPIRDERTTRRSFAPLASQDG